ncbi:FHA domain-containing protein [Nocardia stercoris]|uniref:FHA domain-containing protein n=1 Tax=Nocardia stercoris TaxID=2483361 RepID=A0A3M2L7E0_9NOCA|nr:FHA domain-containing protein [Nocardia stercoris]
MTRAQVEVVAGNHVVVRVSGVIVVVGHRERGPLTAASPALQAAEALAALVSEAADQAPDGPGRLIAREATRWLIRDADQIIPERAIDLGILSTADTGGVAIFLHGRVTALLAGADGIETYRGVDAAFTIDRVVEQPAHAVAVFLDDDSGQVPALPERGIGALTEGVLPGSGAIAWFGADRARARDEDGPTMLTQRPRPQQPPTAQQLDVVGRPQPESRPQGERPQQRPPFEPVPPTNPPPFPQPTAAQPATPPPLPQPTAAQPATPPPLPQPQATPPPLPQPDPDLERRLEATAKADLSALKVLGFKCARSHPSDPRAAFCTVCGMPVDQTQAPTEVLRPPLGVLMLDDGTTIPLAVDVVIGREPETSDAARNGLLPIRIDDASGGMSRAHAEFRLINWDVTVVDRGSTNGTRIRPPGYPEWVRVQPNQPIPLQHGTEVMLGNRVLRLDPTTPPPFG